MGIQIICPICGSKHIVTINDMEAYEKWQSHELCIQEAFPDMSLSDRELLISGICNECFNKIFKDEE